MNKDVMTDYYRNNPKDIVYALLAGAMKPLNVLSKFENRFVIRTVRFQVQLEADGYFFLGSFRICNRSKQVFSTRMR